jgi:hypothetical protein
MATYTYKIDDGDVSIVATACATRGTKIKNEEIVGWGIEDYFQDVVNGHVATFKQYAAQADAAGKEAKLAAYDAAKPTLDKMDALKPEEAKIVQDILDGKVAASDVTVAEKP